MPADVQSEERVATPVTPAVDQAAVDAAAEAARKAEEAQARLDAAEEARKVAEAREARLFEAYNQVINQPLVQHQVAAPPAPQLPDRDEDPDGYIEAKIAKGVEAGIQQHVAPVVQQYGQDRQITLNNAIEQQKMLMRNDTLTYPGYKENEEAINEFAAQFRPDELARPHALQECYFRVMGRKHAEATRAQAVREAGPEVGGRVGGGAPEPEPVDQLTDKEKRFMAREGLDAGTFKSMQGAGSFSVEDFNKTREGA